jgi:hypoxanthine phosphoribosyltransferase
LLDALRAVHPGAEANLAASARLLREEGEVLDALVDAILDGRGELAVGELAGLPTGLARLVLARLADGALGAPVPGAGRRLERVLALAERGGTAELDLGSGARAVLADGRLRVAGPKSVTDDGRLRVAGPRSVTDDGRLGVAGPRGAPEAGGLTPSVALQVPGHPTARLDCGVMDTSPAVQEGGAWAGDPAIGRVLVERRRLQERIRELGEEISRDYTGRSLLLVGVLKGAFLFVSDLMRQIHVPCEVDFMAVASYGSATDSSGVVRILKDLDAAIADRDVLIVEDIVDSGLTLQYLLRNLGARNPRSLEVCALLTKPERRKVDLPTRYVGFEIPNEFAIGYGLDHGERFRNLPYVAALAQ